MKRRSWKMIPVTKTNMSAQGVDAAAGLRTIVVGSISMKKKPVNEITLPLYDDERQKGMQTRLSRIEGQVRGVSRMLEEQRPCIDVLQQLASVQAALKGVTKDVLRNYLERCATDAIKSGDTSIYDKLMEAIYKFAK